MRTKRELDECEYGAWVKIRVEKRQWARQFLEVVLLRVRSLKIDTTFRGSPLC
jgi:hypothetical protein